MIGRRLAHYQISAALGAGGMGEVYLARDTKLGREVALKVLPPELAGDPERLARFEREARALAALDHPNIVTVFSVEEADGVHFLTMAHVEGRTLAELIPPAGLPLARLLELALPLTDALRAAHEHGVVHRDLKPANVMVDRDGRLRVLDFGLAKLRATAEAGDPSELPTATMTREGAILGTYPYMSPEQAEGRPVDARSDIFSLGVMLYEMATGERPFQGETPASLVAAILKESPAAVDEVRAELPHHLGRIVRRCLEKNPERRYQRAKDLLHELEDLAAESGLGAPRAPAVTPPPAPRPAGRRTRLGLLAALGLVALVLGLLLYPGRDRRAPGGAREPIRSLAVLPLDNLMDDPEQEYFVDGMTEALIADLAKIGSLKVISRTSAMRYKQTEKSAPEIARDLAVDAIVEGSVLRAGDQVRITAQLIDGTTDQHLWVETYDRSLTDVLALHSEVARAIAGEIQLQLTPGEQLLLADSSPVDPKAYEAYLEGRFHLWQFTAQGVQKAGQRLQRALELDPGLAPAHATLANLHFYLGFVGAVPPRRAMPLAREAALRALEIDERNADAHIMLGFVHLTYDLDFPAVAREARRTLELNPSEPRGHWLLANYLAVMGDHDGALDEVRAAKRLDPLEALYSFGEGYHLSMVDRWAEAADKLRSALEINPDLHWAHGVLSYCLVRQGQIAEGIREQAQTYRLFGRPEVADALEDGYRQAGLEAAFRNAAEQLERTSREQFVSPSGLVYAYAWSGDSDRAFEWLERAIEARDGFLALLRRDPGFEPLRADPRFDEVTRRLGLPD